MDGEPVDVSLTEVLPREPSVRAIELKVLQVHFDDARAERADPVLRIAVEDNVADVEVRLQPRRIELVDVPGEFDRAQEELVPHLLDGDDDFEILRHREQALPGDPLRTSPRIAVRGR